MITRRLAGGIGAARVVGGCFREAPRGPQRAEHLVGADVVEAEVSLALGAQLLPMGPHRLEQMKGAAHVAVDVDEVRRACRAVGARALDRAVHMALGRQVHYQVGVGLAHRRCCGLGVGEVHPQQGVALSRLGQGLDAGEVACVAALVEVEHQGVALLKQPAHHRAADKAGAAGHQDAVAAGEQGGNVGWGGVGHGRGGQDAIKYVCTKLVTIGIGLSCLGWKKVFEIKMRRRPGGGWGSMARPCWKPSLEQLLA